MSPIRPWGSSSQILVCLRSLLKSADSQVNSRDCDSVSGVAAQESAFVTITKDNLGTGGQEPHFEKHHL